MKNILKIKNCLISVSDKTGIVNLAADIQKNDIDIISTGNTFKKLKENKIRATKVETLTKVSEILDGRVKTLHPKIFGGILANPKNPSHKVDMKKHYLKKIELVIVNLYPFENVISRTKNINICIENIDIGGPSMIRAAAKNYNSTAVVVDKHDYGLILKEIFEYKGITLETRKKLALKAFQRTMEYLVGD